MTLVINRDAPLPVTATTLPLPSGAATEATLATRLAEATFTGRINTQGQKAMAASTPVVIASDQSAIPITGSISANSSADVLGVDGDAGYTDGDLAKNLTQTEDGRLRTAAAALVDDRPQSFVDGETRTLSLTNEGRLRVSSVEARLAVGFYMDDERRMWGMGEPSSGNLFGDGLKVNYAFSGSPWGDW